LPRTTLTAALLSISSLWTQLCAAGAIDDRYGNVDEARLAHASQEPGQWFTVGRDGDDTYYSPLHQINAGNVARLGFGWEYRTNTSRGMAATPLVVDGVMYTSGNRGVVYALDAATGKPIWVFDPLNKAAIGRAACCDVVNRGVAVWKGKVLCRLHERPTICVGREDGREDLAGRHAHGRARGVFQHWGRHRLRERSSSSAMRAAT